MPTFGAEPSLADRYLSAAPNRPFLFPTRVAGFVRATLARKYAVVAEKTDDVVATPAAVKEVPLEALVN